jgi:hypothetical protein
MELVSALDDRPALDQTDAILAELQQMPRDYFVVEVIDALLDYRVLLVDFNDLGRQDSPPLLSPPPE